MSSRQEFDILVNMQNKLSVLANFLLLISFFATYFTGDNFEDLHEFFANATIFLMIVHIFLYRRVMIARTKAAFKKKRADNIEISK